MYFGMGGVGKICGAPFPLPYGGMANAAPIPGDGTLWPQKHKNPREAHGPDLAVVPGLRNKLRGVVLGGDLADRIWLAVVSNSRWALRWSRWARDLADRIWSLF
uniref:Uncharacterized protein n=1 Tax=Fagus sylvatica TaxID=28930 RepID=A0A2N9J5L7_FAGSY